MLHVNNNVDCGGGSSGSGSSGSSSSSSSSSSKTAIHTYLRQYVNMKIQEYYRME